MARQNNSIRDSQDIGGSGKKVQKGTFGIFATMLKILKFTWQNGLFGIVKWLYENYLCI